MNTILPLLDAARYKLAGPENIISLTSTCRILVYGNCFRPLLWPRDRCWITNHGVPLSTIFSALPEWLRCLQPAASRRRGAGCAEARGERGRCGRRRGSRTECHRAVQHGGRGRLLLLVLRCQLEEGAGNQWKVICNSVTCKLPRLFWKLTPSFTLPGFSILRF